jgi:tripeptide aminopeptidase
MDDMLAKLPEMVNRIREIRDVVISNIVLVGQTPAPTFEETARAEIFLERLSDAQADFCSADDFNNPVGVITGTSGGEKPPIFIVANLDTVFSADIDHDYTIRKNTITGPGIIDNSASIGVMASLPFILRKLDIRFESDIILAGVLQSIGKGNLAGVRHLLANWDEPIRGAVILAGAPLGMLNYYSEGIIRGEIQCQTGIPTERIELYKPNAILILNGVIDGILRMPLPQRPRSRVIIGRINGGHKHGVIAVRGDLGFEIQSDSDNMVKQILAEIEDIVNGTAQEHHVQLTLEVISQLNAATLTYRHPLVKAAASVMKRLGVMPVSEFCESELSLFLSEHIPAITLGLSEGKNTHMENATLKIEPLFTGIVQVIGTLMAINGGVCDG